MNLAILILPALLLYALGYRFYSRYLERRFGTDDARLTPAVRKNDGCDYVPTPVHILFAHHFSAIAAAGPILGPTWALLYGVMPAWAWIIAGGILIGAVHDFSVLFVSMREEGKSIAEIARKTLGGTGYTLYVLFLIFNLVIVNATFLNLTAVALTSLRAPADLGLGPDQQVFHTVVRNGREMAVVGGIASMSAIALTLMAPILGWLLIRKRLRMRYAYPLATILCVISVWVGFVQPVMLPINFWMVSLSIYLLVAAAVPVWLILQPREFVSVQFLYLGIGLIFASVLAAAFKGVPIQAPAINLAAGARSLGALWPMLFITIACGAISGFHGLVASGTTSKMIQKESDARKVGYLAMIGESILALAVTLAVATGVSYAAYQSVLVRPADAAPDWKPNPVLAFGLGVAGICEQGLGIPRWLGVVFGLLMVEGFVLDTLDVSIRLNRYLLEEIWGLLFQHVPALLKSFWFNAGISVFLMIGLAMGQTAERLWPIFGSGNQLLAALSLVAVSLWLYKARKPIGFTLIPGILVGVTTIVSLAELLFQRYLPGGNRLLSITAVALLVLSAGIIIVILRSFGRARGSLRGAGPYEPGRDPSPARRS